MGHGGGAEAGGDLLTSQQRGVEGDESGYCELPGDAAAAAVIPRATVLQQHPSPTLAHPLSPQRHAHPPHSARLGSGEWGTGEVRTAQPKPRAEAPLGWRGLGGAFSPATRPLGLCLILFGLYPFCCLQPLPLPVGGRLERGAPTVSLGSAATPTPPLQGTVGVRVGGSAVCGD